MPTTRVPKLQVQTQQAVTTAVRGISGPALESEIIAVAAALQRTLAAVVAEHPHAAAGPVALAQALGLDKVLTSRVLKALRQQDSVASLYFMPGPEPLRSLIKAAERRGLTTAAHAAAAGQAVDAFAQLIDVRIGDRSLLDSILSAWIPEARAEFELRRKQAAFKAVSQLKGVQTDAIVATCILAPGDNPDLVDLVWVHGLTGLHRVRPGVLVKLASRRMSPEPSARRAQTLDGDLIGDDSPPLIREFCSQPVPDIRVRRVGESLFYTLGGDGFGAASAVDIFFADVNRSELQRHPLPRPDRPGGERGVYFFAEISVPAKALQLDLLVHEDLYPGKDPALRIHDTAFDGVADPLDARRDLDRIDMLESITSLGRGLSAVRAAGVPRYSELMQHAMTRCGYSAPQFRGYRCAIDYPLHGSQVSMVFSL